jgi:outer membrane biosynthesis protein TonB
MPDEELPPETPAETPAIDEPSAEQPPVEEPAPEEPPAEEPPAEAPPTEEPPAEEPPIDEPEDDGGIEAAAAALDADVARVFAFEGLNGQARATARRFHTLALHVVEVLPAGNARAVALAKLRKARGAVLRPMLIG